MDFNTLARDFELFCSPDKTASPLNTAVISPALTVPLSSFHTARKQPLATIAGIVYYLMFELHCLLCGNFNKL